jgi:hypothetical protein
MSAGLKLRRGTDAQGRGLRRKLRVKMTEVKKKLLWFG